jgi:hypothetical protein
MAASVHSPHTRQKGHDDKEEAMPDLSERRHDAWTALAAEPAVRAAERAIVTESPTILADTLAISVAAESRRRLARVYALKDQAERDTRKRDAYQRAAHDLRTWAADAYLATRGAPYTTDRASTSRPDRADRQPVVKHANPYTEESISLRRLVPRPPFPGQRKRHPRNADSSSETQRADLPAEAVERDAADARSTNSRKCQGDGMSCNLAATRRSRPGSLSTQPAAGR